MSKWQEYSYKFENITPREQYLIIISGLVAIIFIAFSFFIDEPLEQTKRIKSQIVQAKLTNQNNLNSIKLLEDALTIDPNIALNKELSQYQAKLGEIDEELLMLTSDLIDPVEMRYALSKLLKLQKGVKIVAFEVLEAQIINTESKVDKEVSNEDTNTNVIADDSLVIDNTINLYRHGIRIRLQGRYFQLASYLTQLENLSWKFFWQSFDYKIKNYPTSELEIEIYSLSTAQEFIGV